MGKKLSNDENIKNLNKRKWLRIFVIFFILLTLFLLLLNIVLKVSIIYPIITFIIYQILFRIREKIPINKVDDLESVRKEIEKTKKKRK